ACRYLVGARLGPGRAGRLLGLALAWAYAACPWTLLVLMQATNDGLVALLLAIALLISSSQAGRGVLLGLAAASKFAPLSLAALFARVGRERGGRRLVVYAAALLLTAGLAIAAYLPDGGV